MAAGVVSGPCVALWQPGKDWITVSCPQGGSWDYLVTPEGDKPSGAFLAGTPWRAYPGSEWTEQPPGMDTEGRGLEWDWVVAVYPESVAAARDLGIAWPLG